MNRRLVSLLDQALASAANLGLSVGIARIYGPVDFAGFGFGLTIAMMIQSIQRGGYVVPLSITASDEVRVHRNSLLSVHALLMVVFISLGVASYTFGKITGAGQLIASTLAATITCLAVQTQIDVVRVFAIKAEKPILALAFSGIQAITFTAVLLAGYSGLIRFEPAMLVIASVLLVAGAVILFSGARLNLFAGWLRLRRLLARTLGWATLGTIASWGYTHFPLLVLGAMAPPIHAAAFVATRSLMQPIQILARSADIVDKHDLSGTRAGPGGNRGQLVRRFAMRNLVLIGVVGGVVFAFAEPLLRLVYGEAFAGFADTLRLWAAVFAILPFLLLLEGLVHAGHHLKGYTIAQIIAGGASTLVAPLLVQHWRDTGAVLACLIGWLIVTAGAFVVLKTKKPGR